MTLNNSQLSVNVRLFYSHDDTEEDVVSLKIILLMHTFQGKSKTTCKQTLKTSFTKLSYGCSYAGHCF